MTGSRRSITFLVARACSESLSVFVRMVVMSSSSGVSGHEGSTRRRPGSSFGSRVACMGRKSTSTDSNSQSHGAGAYPRDPDPNRLSSHCSLDGHNVRNGWPTDPWSRAQCFERGHVPAPMPGVAGTGALLAQSAAEAVQPQRELHLECVVG